MLGGGITLAGALVTLGAIKQDAFMWAGLAVLGVTLVVVPFIAFHNYRLETEAKIKGMEAKLNKVQEALNLKKVFRNAEYQQNFDENLETFRARFS